MSIIKKLISRLGIGDAGSPGLPPALIAEYDQTRQILDKKLLCQAPFSNLYFNSEGHVALCWQTFHKAETYTSQKTLKELWNSLNFERIREGIKNHNLDFACTACKNHLLEKNFTNILAKAYDNDFPRTGFPSIIEFELSNTCNLGCTMCNGMLSSTIRKDRENLPPLQSPYGEKFLTELREFIPHLKEARFNGGEPFLIKIYTQIWDMVAELNPGLKMVIATNGTVLNSKVKEQMARANFHFNISIDGITKESYESIRINGNFDKLMENFLYFRDYCIANNRNLCVMVNPLRQNWRDMPLFINFCNAHNVSIWFNTITKPAEQALWSLPASELQRVYETLSAAPLDGFASGNEDTYNYNVATYNNLVQQQIKTWWQQAIELEKQGKALTIAPGASFKTQAMGRLTAYFKNRQSDFDSITSRLTEIDALLAAAEEEALYKNILDSNPETVLDFCKNNTAENLLAIFRQTKSTA